MVLHSHVSLFYFMIINCLFSVYVLISFCIFEYLQSERRINEVAPRVRFTDFCVHANAKYDVRFYPVTQTRFTSIFVGMRNEQRTWYKITSNDTHTHTHTWRKSVEPEQSVTVVGTSAAVAMCTSARVRICSTIL